MNAPQVIARGGAPPLPNAPVSNAVDQVAWHALPAADVCVRLGTDARLGLTDTDAAGRLGRVGRNALGTEPRAPWWKAALDPLTEPLVLLLVVVAVLYALFGERADAITILVVIVAVSAIELANEGRAKRALRALASLSAPAATVLRAGAPRRLPADGLVPGDVVLLAAGHRVPADLRLLASSALRLDESSLTGESVPVAKRADATLPPTTDLGDRATMAYAGTLATAGQGRGVVVATGPRTELARIAGLGRAAREPRTPLQQQLRQLAGGLLWVAVGFSVLVPVLSVVVAHRPWREALLTGLTLAFATIPEELPLLTTGVLGLGAYRLAREHAIARRLCAAETLGSVSVVATDKTGTLTAHRMRVADVVVDGERRPFDASSGPPRVVPNDAAVPATLARLLAVGALATGAQVTDGTDATARFLGDPTDTALLHAADQAGVLGVRDAARVVAEFPFDDARQRVAAVHDRDGERWLAVKGAPEAVLAVCTHLRLDGQVVPLDDARRQAVARAADALAADGQRVIACAERRLAPHTPSHAAPSVADEADLTLLGLAGLEDPPRAEVPAAVRALQGAGIRVLMMTGDHPATAAAIAARVGINARRVVTGREIAGMDDATLRRAVADAAVFARITPEHKLRLVQALQADGAVVAVIGDGVNDAPALRQAAIGVAMGRGSDVAREAADLVLGDDHFATVVTAIRSGRVLHENLWKAVRYYLAAKVGLIAVSLGAVLAGLPLPFAPVQIIILELFMDLGASTTFVAERPEGDVMARPPRPPGQRFMDGAMVLGILGGGISLAAAVLVAYGWAVRAGLGTTAARTAAFAAWLFGHVVLAAHMRSAREPLLGPRLGPRLRWSVPFAVWVGAATVLAAVGTLVPWLSRRLALAPLPARGWLVIVGAALLLPSWWEPVKWAQRARRRGARPARLTPRERPGRGVVGGWVAASTPRRVTGSVRRPAHSRRSGR